MTARLDPLFSSVQVGSLSLRNRIIVAPLTCSRAGEGATATPTVAEYYRQRASAGLIITEGSHISPCPTPGSIFTDAQVADWRPITDAVHEEGGRIFLRLWHVGLVPHSDVQPTGALAVAAPSAIAVEGLASFETPRALAIDEIPNVVAAFRRGAMNAKQAGFDGVEVHGANGCLIDQFLRDGTNDRTDEYGGSLENRARLMKEIIEAIIPVFGAERVGVRLSPILNIYSMGDSNPQATFGHAVEVLGSYGLAYLHVVQLGEGAFDFVSLKRRFGGTYIASGGYDAMRAAAAVRLGEADLVSFGARFLANPDFVERFRPGGCVESTPRCQ